MDVQGVDMLLSEEMVDFVNEIDNSVYMLVYKVVNWMLDDMFEICGLVRFYWVVDCCLFEYFKFLFYCINW